MIIKELPNNLLRGTLCFQSDSFNSAAKIPIMMINDHRIPQYLAKRDPTVSANCPFLSMKGTFNVATPANCANLLLISACVSSINFHFHFLIMNIVFSSLFHFRFLIMKNERNLYVATQPIVQTSF